MDEEIQQKLYDKYPALFVNKDKDPRVSCMAWGIECGDGWYDLLATLCYRIAQHEKNIAAREKKHTSTPQEPSKYYPVQFTQIKEKFGGLRIYWDGGDEHVAGVIRMAEEMSYKLCERCGNKGQPNKQGWVVTLCDNCRGSADS
jgi:NADH pyrophosphatase NudC (nudix superfamily)